MTRRAWPRILAGLGLSGALLYWTLRDVPPDRALSSLRTADISFLLCAAALAVLTIPLRAVRWRFILSPEQPACPRGSLFHALALGLMANNLLPARIGEFVRAWAARRLTEMSFSTAISSIALERMIDLVTILGMAGIALAAGGWPAPTPVAVRAGGVLVFGTAAVTVGLGVAAASSAAAGRRLRAGVARILALLPTGWRRDVDAKLEDLSLGVSALRHPRLLILIGIWSLVIWSTNAAAFWIGAWAFQISIPWTGPLLLQGFVVLGLLLPSTPGYFGPFEAACRLALGFYAVPIADSVSFALVFHLSAFFVPVVLIGLWSLARSGITYSDVRESRKQRQVRAR